MNIKTGIMTALLAAALVACACSNASNQNPAEDRSAAAGTNVRKVQVFVADYGEVPQTSIYSASIQANAINNIAPQSASRIQRLFVDVGDFVKEGQIVAEMDKVQLDQAALKLKNAGTELERAKQLLEEGGIAVSDFESLELSYRVAKSTYDNLLENAVLCSPIAGVISARNYDRGDMYSMGQPIFVVQQITPVKILVGVSESDYTRVRKGDRISLTVDAIPGSTFTGTINKLYPTMDASSHTFNVEVLVRNENRQLRPGMYARVKIDFGSTRNIVVPDASVIKQQGSGQRSVFVVLDDNTADTRVVTLGRHFDDKYEIISGLSQGERVVCKGQTTLKDGIAVEVENK